jgi:hypothetical protein
VTAHDPAVTTYGNPDGAAHVSPLALDGLMARLRLGRNGHHETGAQNQRGGPDGPRAAAVPQTACVIVFQRVPRDAHAPEERLLHSQFPTREVCCLHGSAPIPLLSRPAFSGEQLTGREAVAGLQSVHMCERFIPELTYLRESERESHSPGCE